MAFALLPLRRSRYTETFFFQGDQPMLATIDRPAETASSLPEVLPGMTFNEEDDVINATVIISQRENGTYHHQVPPLSVAGPAGSNWTVIWTLAPVDGLSATFRDGGVRTTSVPAGVDNPNSTGIFSPGAPSGAQPIKWQFTFINNVTDVNVIRYDLLLDVKDSEGHSLSRSLIIDPTISVVREPLG
jgi:hypothetical protein